MAVIDVDKVVFEFGPSARIIDGISFDADKGEFVSVIGPSGCGKSTLLRIIAGLIRPTSGRVRYNGAEVRGPMVGISFVFQEFGLMPWLTASDNVRLGLSLTNFSEAEKSERTQALLEKMGLTGFEDAYPNMLSGGMKQRVGIARAIASDPNVLLMDEPFSSLDELTAETLRDDVYEMLKNKNISVSSVIMVTHNVEEAVELSDRIVVLSNKPSRVDSVVDVGLGQPRDRHSKKFMNLVDEVYTTLTRHA